MIKTILNFILWELISNSQFNT